MLAFALSIALFAYWSVLGFSLVSRLNSRRNLLRNALLSPALGAAATVILILWVSVVGIPLKRAALALTVALFAGAVVWLRGSRPILPIKQLVPFLLVLILASSLTGYPLLRFGFDWVSFGNDDMANYTLGATYLSNYGFFPPPPPERIVEDRDASAVMWYYLVAGGERPGIELANAWVSSTTGLSSHQTYMPVMLALHLVLISAAGALLLQCRAYRLPSVLACIALACSSLNTLGTLYQLMAQVLGVALLIGACVMSCAGCRRTSRRLTVGRIVLSTTLTSALLIVYPELLPCFLVAVFLYHCMLLVRKQESWRLLIRLAAYIGLGTALTVNVACVGIVTDAVRRMSGTFRDISATGGLFPFYLIPSGLAHLWGFYPIGERLAGGLLSLGIVLGALLLLGTCIGAVWLAWRGQVVAILCVTMIGIGMRAFILNADFVLYKVAMYVQPFLLGTAFLSWFQLVARLRRKWLPARLQQAALLGPLAILVAGGLTAQVYYTRRSLGAVGGFVEIPNASSSRLISRLIALSRQTRPTAIVSDTDNVSLGKIESNYTMPAPLLFTAQDFVGRFVQPELPAGIQDRFLNWMMPGVSAKVRSVYQERSKRIRHLQFDTHGALPSTDQFTVRTEISSDAELARCTFLQSIDQGIVNRRNTPNIDGALFRTLELAHASDLLIFASSEFGVPYYTSPENRFAGRVSMFQQESDFFYPKSTMVSLGRDSLFRVVNPSSKFRLVLEYTASLNGDGESRIPPISVVGVERTFVAAEGRGSARLFSPVIQPQRIGGGSYVLLDLGRSGFRFPNRRTGLMALYGTHIPLDLRVIVGFGRDISALSEEEYEDMAAPEGVANFPADLLNKGLEYSGIYEDGWVAESSYVILEQKVDRSPLLVRLTVPSIAGRLASSRLIVLMDGSEVARESLTARESTFTIPGGIVGKHRVELVFDGVVKLPAPDTRPVSAMIRSIGFSGAGSAVGNVGAGSTKGSRIQTSSGTP